MKIGKNKKTGISLIVLVITIIVMIILATAVVLTLSNSGIISKANDAVDATDLANMQDIASMLWADKYLDLKEDGVIDAKDLEDLKEAVKTGLSKADKNYATKYNVEVTEAGVTVTKAGETNVPKEWQASVSYITEDGVPIPKGFVASPYGEDKENGIPAENTKAGGLVIYELNDKDIDKEDQFTSWTTRNQYVWVPVDKAKFTTEFTRNLFGINYNTLYGSDLQIVNTLGTNPENGTGVWEAELGEENMPNATLTSASAAFMSDYTLQEVQEMYASVKEYGGFYIARYEAGVGSETRTTLLTGRDDIYSMMGKIPYDVIPWASSDDMNVDEGGAVQVARSLYPKNSTNTTGVISTLTYGVQWDRTLQWMKEQNSELDLTNSTTYGNHLDTEIAVGDLNSEAKFGVLNDAETAFEYDDVPYDNENKSELEKDANEIYALSTGALKKANVNNIYDMAGNMFEWTMEGGDAGGRVIRGGFCAVSGSSGSVAIRVYNGPTDSDYGVSFRPALYIKK